MRRRAPAKADQTLIIRNGRIASIGSSAAMQLPAGAITMDLTGKSVIPGLVMVHEHLHYPIGPDVYGNVTESFSRLYLAGGVTSMRISGGMNGIGEFNLKKSIDAGTRADLVVIDGDPSVRIADMRNVTLVFKQGVAYDPA